MSYLKNKIINNETDVPIPIYIGPRDDSFKQLIKNILVNAKLKHKYLDQVLTLKNLKLIGNAFTAESANPKNNSEIYEQLGDLTINKFIVWYMYKRFPQLNCTDGVKIVARLRINYGSKDSFFNIASNLGFWDYISASVEEREHRKKPLLEDSFEAFVGVIESILDNIFGIGVGYGLLYTILKSIFDNIPISLKYEDLYDAKTRLKELFDIYPELSDLIYKEDKTDNITTSNVFCTINKNTGINRSTAFLGSGMASLKSDAQQKAAISGLKYLNARGYIKNIAPIYTIINQ